MTDGTPVEAKSWHKGIEPTSERRNKTVMAARGNLNGEPTSELATAGRLCFLWQTGGGL